MAPTMGAEDFSYYGQRVPGMIARLGVRNEARGFVHPPHHPRFDLDEGTLPLGAALLADVATRRLAGRDRARVGGPRRRTIECAGVNVLDARPRCEVGGRFTPR